MHPGFGAEFHYTIFRETSFESKTEDLGEFGIPALRVLYLIDSENRKVILLDVDLKE